MMKKMNGFDYDVHTLKLLRPLYIAIAYWPATSNFQAKVTYVPKIFLQFGKVYCFCSFKSQVALKNHMHAI